jgi:hypothetical protein
MGCRRQGIKLVLQAAVGAQLRHSESAILPGLCAKGLMRTKHTDQHGHAGPGAWPCRTEAQFQGQAHALEVHSRPLKKQTGLARLQAVLAEKKLAGERVSVTTSQDGFNSQRAPQKAFALATEPIDMAEGTQALTTQTEPQGNAWKRHQPLRKLKLVQEDSEVSFSNCYQDSIPVHWTLESVLDMRMVQDSTYSHADMLAFHRQLRPTKGMSRRTK